MRRWLHRQGKVLINEMFIRTKPSRTSLAVPSGLVEYTGLNSKGGDVSEGLNARSLAEYYSQFP